MRKNQNVTAGHTLANTGYAAVKNVSAIRTLVLILLLAISPVAFGQLGVYEFTGSGSCPNSNTSVTSQPANASFSDMTNTNSACMAVPNTFAFKNWTTANAINLTEYHEFTVTPDAGFALTLTSLTFNQQADDDNNSGGTTTTWALRSSADGFASNIAAGTIDKNAHAETVPLPAADFTATGAVTFRIYAYKVKTNNTVWGIDDVTLFGSVVALPATPGDPVSNSPQCAASGVVLSAVGAAPAGETWYWQTSANGTSTANSGATYTVFTSGTYYLRSQDNTTLAWSNGAGSVTVTVTPDVSTPTFTLGATSTRCLGAGTVTYTATAANNTGLSYDLDAASLSAGLTIDNATGAVTYPAAWTGISVITVTASGCDVPKTATHTVTTNGAVTAPVFALGSSSTRCQGAGTGNYSATSTGATSISYSIDLLSQLSGNSINASTGVMTFSALWLGTTTITATATGCGGTATSTHTVSIAPSVGVPAFAGGATSTRCQGAGTITYTATASNSTGITYSLNAAAIAAGNSIDAVTGEVTYVAGWTGNTIITASAAGCSGPRTANHTVTTTPTVSAPVFTLGASSTRCQGTGTVTYTATASNSTGMSYTLDAASLAAGNSINAATGAVTYVAGWNGSSVITANAAGCNGPSTSSHTVTITPTVGVPVFSTGANSTRCQGPGTVTYLATATNATGITYLLDAISLAGGNTINATSGVVTYAAAWSGTSVITARAAGCNGPQNATHTVTITPTVGVPVFALGATSTRCQGATATTYSATATNSTGMSYSLDATSVAAGNSIDAVTGIVTYVAGWTGSSVITASATGCNGPRTSTHTVTTTPTVGVPVFALGATTTRCQGAGSVTYSSTATNTTGITYSLDAASLAGGNTINATTGAVTYAAAWSGTTTITASAAGCNGPRIAIHTVTITPTVGLPVFALGATSTRCQGAGSVTYSATATNSTGITYSLDAASLAGGNTINATTGAVTYAAAWSGTTTITASAAGCNGPRTSTHVVTVSATIGAPVFSMGVASTRLQGAGTVTYTATAANTTALTYTLDAASVAAGNTINAATGAVTYTAAWSGTSTITVSAAGCGGPKTATHTVTINATWVYKQLYLSDPSQALDRVDPVNTADATTASTTLLSTAGTTSATFTMAPTLCDSLVIKAGTITVRNYVTISSGTMPANPAITAVLRHNGTPIITLSNPVYAGGMLTWTGTLAADVTVPAGEAISLQVTTAVAGVTFRIDFDSQTKPSRIDIPVSTFIKVTSLDVYSAAYPGGIPVVSGVGGTTKYIRAQVTDPFGTSDITALNIKITPGSIVSATSVNTSGCTRTYEYVWTTPATSGTYNLAATAREGYENTVTNTKDINFDICATCAPVAVNDAASGAGGTPIVVNVLSNDYDPNNNLNTSSLTIIGAPRDGSAYISNNNVIYLPNGVFSGKDTLTYQICDLTSPTPLCATAQVVFNIDPLMVDICADAAKTHTYYIPYPEQQAWTALEASGSPSMPSNYIHTVISVKIPYPGMVITWDEWEDGYEANIANPVQSSTKVWGDGNPYNGIAPGYPSDIIPAGGSIILDNTMIANPRNSSNIYYDGKDKVVSNGQIALTQVCGEPSIESVQSIKTNVTSVYDFGQSFTIPLGENFPSQDFKYTGLFIRASQDNTTVNIDKNNDGVFETTTTLNQGNSYLVNGGVLTGATVASDKPVGVELNAGGKDNYSIRNAPIYPATWYGNTYYTPVPTSDNAGDNPKDTSVVMFYNSLSRPINVNWYSGAPANGVITIPGKTAVRFPLAYSTSSTYKFVNLTGESFTAIEIVNSYSTGGTGTSGSAYDWSFNLISEARLTDYTTVAWAPGGLDLNNDNQPDVNGNPIWVTPTANTTVYVKYDGNVSGTSGLVSPCGLRYDVAYNVNALNYVKIRDNNDNDQGGMAIYTCNGVKIAAVYGEDPQGSTAGNSSYWDVGSTIQPFCKQKLLIATDDFASTLVSQPVTISVLANDFGFLATVDPSTVTNLGLLQPAHGTVTVNANGTILYIPDAGFSGTDSFEYNVCSTPSPIVCDVALVVIKISTCPSNGNQNVISGQVFIDRSKDGLNNDGGFGLNGVKVYLYTDGNCSGTVTANELTDSTTVDSSGFYQFVKYPEKVIEDNFDDGSGGRTCNNGTDGDSPWAGNWTDNDPSSSGFCQSVANADVEITRDGAFGYGLRLKDNDVYASRQANLSGALKAFLTFSYRRKTTSFSSGEDIDVQVSSNGSSFTTIYTIDGDGTTDASYVTIYNQDITAYAAAGTTIRFRTSSNMDDGDSVYIDNVSIRYLKYPQCYIAATAASSVPAGYTATTATSKTMTITAGGTCTSNFDFGYAKGNVTISGTLFNDKNGLVDAAVNGTLLGNPSGATVYAYLADQTGKVAFKTTVNTATGAYSFPLAEVQTSYTLSLSTTSVLLGAMPPASANFNPIWITVGDAYGSNNAAGAGNKVSAPNASIQVKTVASNVTGVNFGIQRLPNSDNYAVSITQPYVNQLITLNGGTNPPVLSGTDPEDCSGGCTLSTKNVVIDQVPNNAELYYNNVLVVNGQAISNFNPSLLKVKITPITLGDTTIVFQYSFVDAAMMKDPTPATYKMAWLIPLPADRLVAVANLDGNITTVNWSTLSEQNTSFFMVERSTDNRTFTETGSRVAAAGNSTEKREYTMNDNVSALQQYNVVYYRVKLTDLDGKITYSNTVAVRLAARAEVSAWPNPFQSALTISITADRAGSYDISLTDVHGRTVKKMTKSVSRGVSQVTMTDLDRLPAGMYIIEIVDQHTQNKVSQKVIRN